MRWLRIRVVLVVEASEGVFQQHAFKLLGSVLYACAGACVPVYGGPPAAVGVPGEHRVEFAVASQS